MMNSTLLELYAELRTAELNRQRRSQPLPPPNSGLWSVLRQRLAQRLVALGLRLDADASRAAVRSLEVAPRLNGSDA
jgi:hypothetical protein